MTKEDRFSKNAQKVQKIPKVFSRFFFRVFFVSLLVRKEKKRSGTKVKEKREREMGQKKNKFQKKNKKEVEKLGKGKKAPKNATVTQFKTRGFFFSFLFLPAFSFLFSLSSFLFFLPFFLILVKFGFFFIFPLFLFFSFPPFHCFSSLFPPFLFSSSLSAINVTEPIALKTKSGDVNERNLTLSDLYSKLRHHRDVSRKGLFFTKEEQKRRKEEQKKIKRRTKGEQKENKRRTKEEQKKNKSFFLQKKK